MRSNLVVLAALAAALLEGVPAGELLVRAEGQRSGWIVEPGPRASERVELARSARLRASS